MLPSSGWVSERLEAPITPLTLPIPYVAIYRDEGEAVQLGVLARGGAHAARAGGEIHLVQSDAYGVVLLDWAHVSLIPAEEFVAFEDDDETPHLACSALYPLTERPYLILEDQLAESSIDLAEGRSVIGQMNIRILDRRTDPADQSTGWLTALLAGAGGHSALNGRRGLRRRWVDDGETVGFRVLLDGVITGVFLERYPDWVTYMLPLRDIRERERRQGAFGRSRTATVLPPGVLAGFGRWEDGAGQEHWVVPPSQPLQATVAGNASTRWANLEGLWSGNVFPAELAATDAVLRVAGSAETIDEYIDAQDRTVYVRTWPLLTVLWRPVGDSVWREIGQVRLDTWYPQLNGTRWMIGVGLGRRGSADGEEMQGVTAVRLRSYPWDPGDPVEYPAVGSTIEIIVRHNGPPSPDYPLHLEGMTAGELLMALYDGEHSDRLHPTPIRYDQDAMLRMDTPVLGRLTEPVKDLRKWAEEQAYRPPGFAPAIDPDGRISPVRLEPITPERVAELPVIGPDVVIPEDSDWGDDSAHAINVVRLTYPRFIADPGSPDGVGMVSATRQFVAVDSVSLLGEQEWEAGSESEPLTLFGSIGTDDEAAVEALGPETGELLFRDRCDTLIATRRFGAQRWVLPCRESLTRERRVGDEVRVVVPWMPSYETGRRGLDACGIIVSILDRDLATRVITVEHVPVTAEG